MDSRDLGFVQDLAAKLGQTCGCKSTTQLWLPGSATTFPLLFGRDVCTQIDAVSPELDRSYFKGGVTHIFVADRT